MSHQLRYVYHCIRNVVASINLHLVNDLLFAALFLGTVVQCIPAQRLADHYVEGMRPGSPSQHPLRHPVLHCARSMQLGGCGGGVGRRGARRGEAGRGGPRP